jgi:hypothetical protein
MLGEERRRAYASFAKVRTRRKAGIPVVTRFMERRDQSWAHRASGKTVNMPAGTGGILRELRVVEELCINRPCPPLFP